MAPIPPSARDRRVMFAMDFRDPVTGLGITCLEVVAEQLGPPIRPPSGRFVWLDHNPPAARNVRVIARSPKRRFADFDEVIAVPAHAPNTPAKDLIFSRRLTPTGLYDPPEGLTGAAGWLVEDGARVPVAGASVSLGFRHSVTQTFTSGYQALTDSGGRFVAVANDLGDIRPDPAPPGGPAGILGWLVVTRGTETRFSGLQPLRAGRVERIHAPLHWATLDSNPP